MYSIHASVYGQSWAEHHFVSHEARDACEVRDYLSRHFGEPCAEAFAVVPEHEQDHFDYGYDTCGGRSVVFVRHQP